jgi:tripartite-type tricarboxylate transporter receptor subunit TctC
MLNLDFDMGFLFVWSCAFCTAIIAAHSYAQTIAYPTRPIRWVIPFAPGGGTDVVARPMAIAMGDALGQGIVYDNRGGGGGLIAGEIVARAAPDGYTLLIGGPALLTTNPHLYAKMPFDVVKDFAPISKIANAPNILGAHPSLPARNVQELIEYCKANPDKVNWASSGIGTGGHLAVEQFQMRTRTKVVHVAFKGAGPALVSLIGGSVQLLIAVPGVFMQHIKGGRVRALAVGSPQRVPILPEVPTLNESGLPGMETSSWYGLVAPTGTPAAAIKTLHAATVKALSTPEIKARMLTDGVIASGNTPEQFAQEMHTESAMWARVIKQAGIKLD